MADTVTAGTTWVNCGTVREAFGDSEGALVWFELARENYEKNLPPKDGRLGGLYNNMGLALASCRKFPECMEMFRKALSVMAGQPNGELEQAITQLNMADALEAELGSEGAEALLPEYLDEAARLLDAPHLPRDGYYAFVCGKCAPVFGHYGYFLEEAELKKGRRRFCGADSPYCSWTGQADCSGNCLRGRCSWTGHTACGRFPRSQAGRGETPAVPKTFSY